MRLHCDWSALSVSVYVCGLTWARTHPPCVAGERTITILIRCSCSVHWAHAALGSVIDISQNQARGRSPHTSTPRYTFC